MLTRSSQQLGKSFPTLSGSREKEREEAELNTRKPEREGYENGGKHSKTRKGGGKYPGTFILTKELGRVEYSKQQFVSSYPMWIHFSHFFYCGHKNVKKCLGLFRVQGLFLQYTIKPFMSFCNSFAPS